MNAVEPAHSPATWFTPARFALILALLLAAAFADVLFGGRTFFFRDYGVLAYPTVFYQRVSFWRGELPLWNPLSNCGVPFLAQWGTMALYPGALLYLLGPLPWALGVFCLGHLFLAGLGTHLLAQRWTAHSFAASLAGLAFVFNGLTQSCLLWPNYTVALGWMPWVVLLAERAWAGGGRRLLLAGGVAALQLLAGAPEIAALTWLVVGGLWLGAAWQSFQSGSSRRQSTEPQGCDPDRPAERSAESIPPAPEGSPPGANNSALSNYPARHLGRLLLRLVLLVALVLGLTAAQTLPFVDLLAHSQRDPGFATAKWSLPIWGWANLFVPMCHCFETTQGLFFQHGQEFFSSTYLGPWLLLLAGWAVWAVRRGRILWLGALGLVGVALALGDNGLLYPWLRKVLPLVGVARYPVKALLLTAFVVPLLGAVAAAHWLNRLAPSPGRAAKAFAAAGLVVLGGMGLVLWLAWRQPLPLDQWPATWRNTVARAVFFMLMLGAWWAVGRATQQWLRLTLSAALLALMWLDFRAHLPRQNPTLPDGVLAPGLAQLPSAPKLGEGRAFITPSAEATLLRSRVADFEADFLGKRLALWSNLNLLESIAKVNGSATLQLREQAQVQHLLYASPETDLPRLTDFLGATWGTSRSNVVEWERRAGALPLVTAGQQPVFVAQAEVLRALAQPGFDGRRVVYLPLEAASLARATNAAKASIRETHFGAQRVEFGVEAEAPAWVVIAQAYYHPWHAWVNGQPARLWPANHAFQALEVPAGASQVKLTYADHWFRAGAGVSALTLLGCAIGWFRLRAGGR